jgi:MFS-type transporter involved in bile tolerance (Atg22 family)
VKENKRAVWSWAFYDWGNSAYSTTVTAGFFPLFFKEYWADPNSSFIFLHKYSKYINYSY